MQEYLVGKFSELPEGKGVAVEAGRRTVAVFKIGADVFAISNTCPHKGASLCEGEVVCETKMVRCPWHHWNWRLTDGALEPDPRQHLRKYDVVVEGDDVILRI
jgi:NAD(P)H-dependent nitrite reductase small subunit